MSEKASENADENRFPIRTKRNLTTLNVTLIGAAITFITVLHFITPLERIWLHEIYQRLYYVPILAAAILFGVRGGLAAALFASITYLPHISLHWQHANASYALNQYAEIVIFNVVGIVTGILGDTSRRARARAERTAAELQNAYSELRRTFEQLLQADRLTALGELSAGVVHEIRNPLGGIKGAVEILEDAVPEDDARREFADIAKREVERLDNLVTEFLKFARPAKPSIAPADLNEIVRAVSALIARRAENQNTVIETTFAPALQLIEVDAEQVKQVLLNLCLNALQAVGASGKLKLRTLVVDKGLYAIEVEDTGGGVNPKIAGRIFDPFFTTKEKGVGLGLSVSYKIAAQHGGALTVTNGEHGAIFRLSLPPKSKDHNHLKSWNFTDATKET